MIHSAIALLKAITAAKVPYSTRATKIDAGLWIGPLPMMEDVPDIVDMKPALIIDCTNGGASRFLDELRLLPAQRIAGLATQQQRIACPMVEGVETQSADTEKAMRVAMELGRDVLARHRTVLVHCRSGLYRSASLAYGILRLRGLSMLEATRVVAKRPAAIARYVENVERVVMRALPPQAWNP
jgi:hypothetical protein